MPLLLETSTVTNRMSRQRRLKKKKIPKLFEPSLAFKALMALPHATWNVGPESKYLII